MANNNDTIVVLLIEDNQADAGLIQAHLSRGNAPSFTVHHEMTLLHGLERLRETIVDIIVLDLSLPDSNGIDTFLRVKAGSQGTPVVILSGTKDDRVALEAVSQGAQDFFDKNEAISESLGRCLQYAIERFHRQLAEREIDTAAFIQQRLFPKPLPPIRGFEVAGRCDPANQVGGDYFDYFMPDNNNLILVVGDVSGHGFGPSLVMAETRAALRTTATTTDDIGVIIHQVNELLTDDELGTFVSLFLARIDITTGICQFASAGHPAELVRHDGTSDKLSSREPPLGIKAGCEFAVRELQLHQADTLLLYTDGVSERSPAPTQLFGIQRMRELVARCDKLTSSETIDRLFQEANDFANNLPADDDMTAIVLKVLSPL